MNERIPAAVGRAATSISEQWKQFAAEQRTASPEDFSLSFAKSALSAALTDPANSDWLACTLFSFDSYVRVGITPEVALEWWYKAIGEDTRQHWRMIAQGLRIMITGEG